MSNYVGQFTVVTTSLTIGRFGFARRCQSPVWSKEFSSNVFQRARLEVQVVVEHARLD